ncbi:MAG: hypothetical protein B6245_23975 [Desulfobacteraceae bacterium 4572_88]|nr:MAG: hypothetical protein B6245_23975 [Desulfobacteraceae bacterium 4572_88]
MKKVFCLFLLFILAATPLEAKKLKELLEMETEDLFEISFEELVDKEISSAGKIAEKISEIPASVHVVTRQDIEKYGYRTLAEVIRNIPGFYSIYDYDDDVIGVRGMLNENNMIILVNGVVQHTSDINEIMMSAEAIDRIEVVRGPMSVIYGSGAFLGSINIVTNHVPYGAPVRMLSASYGSAGTYKTFARLSGEDGNLKYTLNASAYGSDGIEESYQDMMSAERFAELSPNAHQQTDGDLERKNMNLGFSGQYKGLYADFQYNDTENGFFDGEPLFNDGSTAENKTMTAQIGYLHDLSKTFQVDGKITYSHNDMEQTSATYDPDIFGPDAVLEIQGDDERFEAEVNVIWKPLSNFNMVAGLNYKTVVNTAYDASVPVSFGILSADNSASGDSGYEERVIWAKEQYHISDRSTRSLFMQLNYKPFECLKLIAGARLEQYMEFDTDLEAVYEEETIIDKQTKYNTDEKVYFIPRLAAVYSLTDHHILKFMYGEANKPFSPEEIDLNMFSPDSENIEPEEIKTIELNYLISYPRFGISLSLFRNDIGNLRAEHIRENEEGWFELADDNSGRMVTYGSEMIIMAHPFKHLETEFSTTYQETDDKGGRDNIAYCPNLSLKGKVSYHWNGLILGITGLYVDEMDPQGHFAGFRRDADTLGTSDDYFVTDFNLRYDHEDTGLFAGLKISNIFDEEVRYASSGGMIELEDGYIDEGRRFLATVGWKF